MKNKNVFNLILTINDDANYGNRLQNFALQQTLGEYNNISPTIELQNTKESLFSYITYSLKKIIKPFMHKNLLEIKRLLQFKRFNSEHILRFNLFYKNKFCKIFDNTYSVVIGSDQVWNYRWLSKENLALRLGSFVPENVQIISYAASFGVSEISNDVRPIFKRYLPHLKAISVREDRGVELVREITGLEAVVVLDPTLMLDTEQWDIITRGFVSDDDNYVLTYFLGKPSDRQEKTIQEYASRHGCRIRRILDKRDKETYIAGPQDFVELFSKAVYVFTDSYHACCFSILYHKQFTVFNRAGMEGKASMNSRMETLFRLFELDSVVMDDGLAPRIDYEKVDQLLARHRAESQAWLDKAMAGE